MQDYINTTDRFVPTVNIFAKNAFYYPFVNFLILIETAKLQSTFNYSNKKSDVLLYDEICKYIILL